MCHMRFDWSDFGCKELLDAFNTCGPWDDKKFEPVHLSEISNWRYVDYDRSIWVKELRKAYIDEIGIEECAARKWNEERLHVSSIGSPIADRPPDLNDRNQRSRFRLLYGDKR